MILNDDTKTLGFINWDRIAKTVKTFKLTIKMFTGSGTFFSYNYCFETGLCGLE